MSKRLKKIAEIIEPNKNYSLDQAITLLQQVSTVKMVESIDIAINLGIDAKKSDQLVRGSVVLPNGTGKPVTVAVLAAEDKQREATAAGADKVGLEDLIEDIQKGDINFDILIATPDVMPKIAKLGQILGPKGLMPNPKVGTVAVNVTDAVSNAKAGQVQFRTDKNGIIHSTIGKINFSRQAIEENLKALIAELKKCKPANAKGNYFKKMTLSSTMGPGLVLESFW